MPRGVQFALAIYGQKIQQAVNEYMKRHITVAISDCCCGDCALPHAYQQCVDMMSHALYLNENVIIVQSDVIQRKIEAAYSFALHPFFLQRGETRIRTSAGNVMQMTQDKLPTGEIVAVKGTKKDLSQWISPQKIQLDDVFCAEQNPKASIFYCDDKIRVDLNTSDEFKRLVVYTPPNKSWFCLENQTSSTDCHNLHEKGFREAAHLQTVLPHSEKAGFIQFDFKRERIK